MTEFFANPDNNGVIIVGWIIMAIILSGPITNCIFGGTFSSSKPGKEGLVKLFKNLLNRKN